MSGCIQTPEDLPMIKTRNSLLTAVAAGAFMLAPLAGAFFVAISPERQAKWLALWWSLLTLGAALFAAGINSHAPRSNKSARAWSVSSRPSKR